MINTKALLPVFITALCAFTLPLYAHHSSHLFETSTPILLTGVIREVSFANPHSSIIIDITDADGQQVRWAVENSGTLYATREVRGLDENRLQAGDPISVCGYAPKRPYSKPQELQARGVPVPDWWGNADKFITGRLLILKDGPAEHWSYYGPLAPCQTLLEQDK